MRTSRSAPEISLIESPGADFRRISRSITRLHGVPEGRDFEHWRPERLDPSRLLEELPYGKTVKHCAALAILSSLAARDYAEGSRAAEAYKTIAGVMRAFVEIGVRHQSSPELQRREAESNQLSALNYLREFACQGSINGRDQTIIVLGKILEGAKASIDKVQLHTPEVNLRVQTALYGLIDQPIELLEAEPRINAPFRGLGKFMRDLKAAVQSWTTPSRE